MRSDHARRGRGIRAAHRRGLDLRERGKVVRPRRLEIVDAGDKGADLHPAGQPEDFFRDRAGRDPADRFARGRPPAAPVVADAVLGLVGEVGVGRAGTSPASRRRRRAGRRCCAPAARSACRWCGPRRPRTGSRPVLLLARGDDVALAGPPAVQLGLDLGRRQRQAGRAAVDDHAHGAAVAFAPGGDGEEFAEGVGHGSRA